jgi:hypothetical protein
MIVAAVERSVPWRLHQFGIAFQKGAEAAVRASLAQGVGILKTARTLGCGVGTVQGIKAEACAT